MSKVSNDVMQVQCKDPFVEFNFKMINKEFTMYLDFLVQLF